MICCRDSVAELWIQWGSPIEQALKMRTLSSHFGFGLLAKDSGTTAIEFALSERGSRTQGNLLY